MSSQFLRRAALYFAALITVASCGGSGDADPPPTTPPPIQPPPEQGSIAMALSSSSGTVTGSGSLTTVVSVTRSGSFAGSVTLATTGLPAGVTSSFTPTSLAAGQTSSTLSLTVAENAAVGEYVVTVRASGQGVTTVSANYTLTINEAAGATLSVSPGTVTIQQNASGNAVLTIQRQGGYAGELHFVFLGVPVGVEINSDPARTTGSSANVTIDVTFGVEPGTYPIEVRANGSSPAVTAIANFDLIIVPQPTVGEMTFSPTSVAALQGSPSNVDITLTREAGQTGSVTYTVENLPSSITASFSPNPTTGNTTRLTLNVAMSHPVGVISVVVRASIGDRSSAKSLQIVTGAFTPQDFSATINPSALSIPVGGNAQAQLTIARSGGYAGQVSFTASGLPANSSFNAPISVPPQNVVTATFTINGPTTPGTYPITLRGTGVGLTGERTVNLLLTVTAGSGSALAWKFCAPDRQPLWFGVREGSGAWAQVTKGAGDAYNATLNANGQIAYVLPSTGGFDVFVFGVTPQEAVQQAFRECVDNPTKRTVNGSSTNRPASRGTWAMLGGAISYAPAGLDVFTIAGAATGIKDLLAFTVYQEDGVILDHTRGIIRRDINPANGATLPVLDFTSAESFSVSSITENFANTNGEAFTSIMQYITSNGVVGSFGIVGPSANATRSIVGVPVAFRRAGDLHMLTAVTSNLSAPRQIIRYSYNVTGDTDPTFGPLLDPATTTVLGSSPVRIRTTGNWQSDYGVSGATSFIQVSNARSVTVTASRDALGGGGSYTYEIPDFSSAPGWNPTWMLQPGVQTSVTVSLIGVRSGSVAAPTNGTDLISAQRITTITP